MIVDSTYCRVRYSMILYLPYLNNKDAIPYRNGTGTVHTLKEVER